MLILNSFIAAVVITNAFGYSISNALNSHLDISDDRIIGGYVADLGQFPYQISLRGINGTVIRHRCGGSIISDRWILTAAHCIQGAYSNASNLVVVVGAHHVSDDGTTYEVERVVSHPNYNDTLLTNDIALIRTAVEIEFGPNVAAIPIRKNEVDEGVRTTVSGWGVNEDEEIATYLKYVKLYTVTNSECATRHNQTGGLIYDGSICALLTGGHGACFGDSGGPLTTGGKLIGLVSWGRPCAVGIPDVFTRVSVFLDWIAEISEVFAW